MAEDNKESPKKEPCKHRSMEMDESTGMWVCQDCFTTMTKLKYNNESNPSFRGS